MSETSTPRTDAACDYTSPEKLHRVALQLERELTAARAELAKAHRRIHGEESEDCVFCSSKRQTPGGDDPQCYLCALEANMAALRAEQAKPQWLPIESAPRDGTRIVTAEESDKGFWFQEDWWIDDEIEWQYATDPIGWMPLPAAPPRDLREGEA